MPRILVVDDDVEILDLLRAMLEREDYEVSRPAMEMRR